MTTISTLLSLYPKAVDRFSSPILDSVTGVTEGRVTLSPRGGVPDNLISLYGAVGLASEVGEVASLLKKRLRDGADPATLRERLKDELGDVLWYVTFLCNHFNLTLEEVIRGNISKLAARQGLSIYDLFALPPEHFASGADPAEAPPA